MMLYRVLPQKKVWWFIVALHVMGSLLFTLYFPGNQFLLVPHESSWWTILISPLVHSDFNHLCRNMEVFIPMVIVSSYFNKEKILVVYLTLFLLSGAGLFIFGSYGAHIGMSGMVTALVVYNFLGGILKFERDHILISSLTFILFTAVLLNFYEESPGISSDAHITGAVVGFLVCLVQFWPWSRIEIF